jgi:hypothetical protein
MSDMTSQIAQILGNQANPQVLSDNPADQAVQLGIRNYLNMQHPDAIANFQSALKLAKERPGRYTESQIQQMLNKTSTEWATIIDKYPKAMPALANAQSEEDLARTRDAILFGDSK